MVRRESLFDRLLRNFNRGIAMQAAAVLIAGMLLIGSVLLHFRRFKWPAVVKAGNVAAFVYVSLIAGLFLFDFDSVIAFQSAFIKRWVYDQAQANLFEMRLGMFVLFSLPVSLILISALVCRYHGYRVELMDTINSIGGSLVALAMITQGYALAYPLNWLLTTTPGHVVSFSLLVLAVGALNTMFGVIVVGLNLGLLVIQLVKGQAINLFSLLGLLELAHVDGVLVALSMMFITTVIGALEFAVQHFDFGANHF